MKVHQPFQSFGNQFMSWSLGTYLQQLYTLYYEYIILKSISFKKCPNDALFVNTVTLQTRETVYFYIRYLINEEIDTERRKNEGKYGCSSFNTEETNRRQHAHQLYALRTSLKTIKHRFNHLRNAVNRERKKCRSKFYESKVKQLKSSHPKQWWKSIKALCGMNPVSSASTFSHLIAPSREPNSQSQSLPDLANTINQTFLSPMEHFQSLCSTTPLPITTCNSESMLSALVITESHVFTKLVSIKSSKAPGPDSIPGWLLKENACALAEPISEILNSSYYENKLPSSWKMADVSPIPKQKPVQDISKHLRPISLTPAISKLAEEFVVDRFIKPAILQIVDSRQYGVIPKSSTTQSLIGLVHNLAKATDGSGALVRVVMFDYKKAFDLIDHHILVTKLYTLDIPPEIINWVSDFLTNRQQRVKLASDCYSEWAAVPAGNETQALAVYPDD